MNISFVGTGNVAETLAKALHKAGHKILSIHSRNSQQNHPWIDEINSYVASLAEPVESEILIIAVSDDSIGTTAQALLISKSTIVVHTSGTISTEVLERFDRRGVFYPLQTLHKGIDWDQIQVPILVYSPDSITNRMLTELAHTITTLVYEINDQQRKDIHLAAVMVNNFTNHIVSEAFNYLASKDIDPKVLQPLLLRTMNKLMQNPPDITQTGPAKRGDFKTIQEHLALLSENPKIQDLYQHLSTSIITKFTNQ